MTNKPIKILAIDQATATGWAFGDIGGVISCGSFASIGLNRGEKLVAFGRQLAALVNDLSPDLLVFEEPVNGLGSFEARRWLMALAGQIEVVCETLGVPYCEEHNMRIKGHALGQHRAFQGGNKSQKQKAGKQAMIDAARARGWNPKNDNEADALFLLDLVLSGKGKSDIGAIQ
jgi:hypothetical protein